MNEKIEKLIIKEYNTPKRERIDEDDTSTIASTPRYKTYTNISDIKKKIEYKNLITGSIKDICNKNHINIEYHTQQNAIITAYPVITRQQKRKKEIKFILKKTETGKDYKWRFS